MSVTPLTLKGDASCEFVLMPGPVTSTLHIAVHTMSYPFYEYSAFVAQCDGVKTSLRAIGNEATYCAMRAGSGKKQIIGRVRDRAFVITITTSTANSGAKHEIAPRDEFVNLAQQVAGALF